MNNIDQKLESKNSNQIEYTTYDLFILVISIMSLIIMALFFLPGVDETGTEIAFALDLVFSLIFLYDFFRSLIRAADRREYFLKGGWLDLLGSLPAIPIFRLFRIARLLRIFRTISRMSAEETWLVYKENKADSAFWTTLLLTLFLLTFTSLVIVPIEADSPNAQISNSSDALWWSIVTVTTVGYGDRVPITDSGRILATLLMTFGVALVSVLTSYVTSSLILRGDKEENERRERLEEGIHNLNARFDNLEEMMEDIKSRIPE
jgi:voltage-gated potassium channel